MAKKSLHPEREKRGAKGESEIQLDCVLRRKWGGSGDVRKAGDLVNERKTKNSAVIPPK